MQSNHAHSVLLRELIGRQEEQARVSKEQTQALEPSLTSFEWPIRPPSSGNHLSNHRGNSDNTSIMSKRSNLSLRFRRPDYLGDLKESRAYKRLRHFGRGIGSSAEAVFSSVTGCIAGHWSLLSNMTLGDFSVSEIAVLNLPIELVDVCNPEPFQDWLSMETARSPKSRTKRSSRGWIHNAIETGNPFVVRTLLTMGVDIEALDSNGRTPLVHAIMKHQQAICALLLGKGACTSAEILKSFSSGMDLKERSELLDSLITRALDDGASSAYVAVLRLLVQMALGTNYGDDNRSSGRSMMGAAIDMGYDLAARAIIYLEPRVLVEVDTEGRTPLVHATMQRQKAISKLLLQKGASVEPLRAFTTDLDLKERSELLDHLITSALDDVASSAYVAVLRLLVQMALGTNYGDDNRSSGRSMMGAAIDMGYDLAARAIIYLEPRVVVEVDTEGRTPLVHATMQRQEAISILLLGKGASVEPLKTSTTGMDRKERSELLDPLITRVLDDGESSVNVAVLRLLVQMALGTNYGDDSRSSGRPMMRAAIDMGYGLAVRAIAHLEPRVLVEVDTEGRTPLVHAAQLVLHSEIDGYESLEGICRVLLDNMDIDFGALKMVAMTRIAVSMHNVVYGGYKSILQLLSLIDSHDIEGWTPLASAAFNLSEALCEFLVKKGCRLCLDTKQLQKNQLKPKLSCRIIDAARGGHGTALQLLLDMGADIDEINSDGETALLEAVSYNHLSCVKILIKRGADATISIYNGYGYSVLHCAAWESTNSGMMKFLLTDIVEIRKLVDIKSSYSRTALHYCSYRNNQGPSVRLENSKLLLQAGASLTIKDRDGKTPYEFARSCERKELAKYLWCQLSPDQQAQGQPPPSDW